MSTTQTMITRWERLDTPTVEARVEGAFSEETQHREASFPVEVLSHATSSHALSLNSAQGEVILKEEDFPNSWDQFVSIAISRSRPSAPLTWIITTPSAPVTRCPRCRTGPGLGSQNKPRRSMSTASLLVNFPSLVV